MFPPEFKTAACWAAVLASVALAAGRVPAASLPGAYFPLLEAGTVAVVERLDATPEPTLAKLENAGRWRHFPYAILAPAVLYAKQHKGNRRLGDEKMRDLAIRIGDMLAAEDGRGAFEPRLDSDWDTYMWMEAYRLLEGELGEARKARWRKAIERNVALVWRDASERVDFPWYNSPYIGTSPNHYAHYANNLLLAGKMFGNKEWTDLGSRILHRFAAIEQTPDGYWGEHSRNGPTIGYNHLTLTAVALYWELERDPAALEALRRATTFHASFTYPDGNPIELMNDRNRHWSVSAWGQFAFSNFPDGRGYAELLVDKFDPSSLSVSDLGRLAQDALYYHEGPVEPAPQTRERYAHEMQIPAAIRKTGPWVVALSGIVDTQAVNSRFYLDRQAHLSVFHQNTGLIVSGANSKRQPELGTFSEKMLGQVFSIPVSSRLQVSEERDRLSLAFHTFWADMLIPEPAPGELSVDFVINGKGRPADELRLNLQLVLHDGEVLETGAGRKVILSGEKLSLGADELGGRIRHHGWTMEVDSEAELTWPVMPHNPYADTPEANLEHAVGRLSVPLALEQEQGRYVRAAEKDIKVRIRVE
jgi:hypothetical protein